MALNEAGSSCCKDSAAGKSHDSLPLTLSNSGTYPGIEIGSSSLRTHPLQFSTNAQYMLTHRSVKLQSNSSVDVLQQHSLHPFFSSALHAPWLC